MQDGVVILHGIFRTHRSMRKLARHLEGCGYRVLNLRYPSTRQPIETLAEQLQPRIVAFADVLPGRLHFVGYSMGGLVIRAFLTRHRPSKLGRVVMLGTPNGGSEVADFIRHNRFYRKLYGPAGQQLITDQSAFAHHFGTVDYELGIIAGNKPIDPFGSRIIRQPNDGKVSIASTKLEGAKDHVVLACSHTLFPGYRPMMRQVEWFLREGVFEQVS